MYSEDYCNKYFEKYIQLSPTYIWGMNICKITSKAQTDEAFRKYGSATGQYTQAYYDMKYAEAMKGSGYASDCSGFLWEMAGRDMTAQGYYNSCVVVGAIANIDTAHSCLVFRGTPNKIHHVGYYDASIGEVLHMANSQKNFQHGPLKRDEWSYWGKPDFINYSPTISVERPFKYKGVDMSVYQKNVNYSALKQAGVEFAVLKIINRSLAKDGMFEEHYAGCQNAGIRVFAVYNYSYALDAEEARRDARKVIEALNGRNVPVCLDIEDQSQTRLGEKIVSIINSYHQVIADAGLQFICYTGLSWYNTYIKPYISNINCKNWWIARYYNGYNEMNFEEDPKQNFKPMEGIVAWQYTSSGIVPGINGRADLDVIYKELDSTPSQTSPKPQIGAKIINTVNTGGANLNVRNKPNTSGQIVGKLKNGSPVIVFGVSKETGWLRLSVDKEMWCSNQYVKPSCKGVITVLNSVYIRSADSKLGDIWGFYKNGETVPIYHQSTNTGWYLTDKGWVSNKYVTLL